MILSNIIVKGDLVRSIMTTYVYMWGTEDYGNYIGDFSPNQIGIITEISTYRNTYKILINDLHGWVYRSYIELIC